VSGDEPSGGSLAGRFSRASLTYGLGSFLQRGIGFLLLPIYTAHLTPSEFGVVGVVLATFSAFSVVFGFGLRAAVTRHYYDYVEYLVRFRRYLGSVYTALLLYGTLFALALSLFGRGVFERALPQVPFSPFIPLALWAAVGAATGGILLSLFRAREQAARYVLFELASAASMLAFVLYFVVVQEGGAVGQARALLSSSLLMLVLALALLLREARPSIDVAMVREAVAFGGPVTIHLLGAWALVAADRLLLARMVPMEEVGLYTLGYQIGVIVSVAASASNAAWTPLFYDVARQGREAHHQLGRLASLNVAMSFGVALLLILFGRELVTLLGGPEYAGAASVVPVIVIGYSLQALYFVAVTPIFFRRRTRMLPPVTIAAAAINICLNLMLIPPFGILGAAWATVGAFGFQLAATFLVARRQFRVTYEAGTLSVLGGTLSIGYVMTWGISGWAAAAAIPIKLAIVIAYLALCYRLRIFDPLVGRRDVG